MSVSLNTLPSELLGCVVAEIPSRHTLCNLAQCSRQLYLCTIPHLYRVVRIREQAPREQGNGRLRELASLLIRRPDFAGLVRTLHVSGPSRTTARYPEDFQQLAGPEDRVIPELVGFDCAFATPANASSLSTEDKINCLGQFSPTHKSYYDLILALLLAPLLKVEFVFLDLDIGWNTYYLEQLIRRAACREKPFDTQPPFEALTRFIYSQDALAARSIGFIASLLKLPAIQEIFGSFEKKWDVTEDHLSEVIPSDKNLRDLNSSSSPLTRLDIAVYGLSAVDLGHIFRAPKALKSLFCRICLPACINLTELRHALASQENCLESLSLEYDRVCEANIEIVGSMPSFISFSTLKIFKTSALLFAAIDNIIGSERLSLIDIFPPSLEALHLTRFHARFNGLLEALEHLLAQKSPQQIPSLKRLILEETYSFVLSPNRRFGTRPVKLMDVLWRGTEETAIGRLRSVAAAQSVSLDVIESIYHQ